MARYVRVNTKEEANQIVERENKKTNERKLVCQCQRERIKKRRVYCKNRLNGRVWQVA